MYAQWRATGNTLTDFSGRGNTLEIPVGNTPQYTSSGGPDGAFHRFPANAALQKSSITLPNSYSYCAHFNMVGNAPPRTSTAQVWRFNIIYLYRLCQVL